MVNQHALVIFYSDGKPLKNKWVMVAINEAGLQRVKPASWDGEFYRDVDGLRINGVESWANLPVHPRNKSKRW